MSPLLASGRGVEIACIAEGRPTAMFGHGLCGVATRIASAPMAGPVFVLPLLHKADIAAPSGTTSSGKAPYVTGGVL